MPSQGSLKDRGGRVFDHRRREGHGMRETELGMRRGHNPRDAGALRSQKRHRNILPCRDLRGVGETLRKMQK